MTRVYEVTLPSRISRPTMDSIFDEGLDALVFRYVERDKAKPIFQPQVPKAAPYDFGYLVDRQAGAPLFLYGVPNQDKTRMTAMLPHLHRQSLQFASLVIFRDQSLIPRADRVGLSDLGCESIPSLSSDGDVQNKLLSPIEFEAASQ